MKRYFFIAAVAIAAFTAGSLIDGAHASTPAPTSGDGQYALVMGQQGVLAKKVTITVDYGDAMPAFRDSRVRDEETGKVAKFESMVDAMNYMNANGWQFTQAYVLTVGNQNVYHYLFQRRP